MAKQTIHTDKAPAALGPYSQAVKAGSSVWLAGQIPLIAETMEIIEGDVTAQARQVFTNLQHVCEAAGGSLSDAVKLTIYLTDLGDFNAVNEVMKEFLNAPYPARATVQISALPKGVQVEIDGVLALD